MLFKQFHQLILTHFIGQDLHKTFMIGASRPYSSHIRLVPVAPARVGPEYKPDQALVIGGEIASKITASPGRVCKGHVLDLAPIA